MNDMPKKITPPIAVKSGDHNIGDVIVMHLYDQEWLDAVCVPDTNVQTSEELHAVATSCGFWKESYCAPSNGRVYMPSTVALCNVSDSPDKCFATVMTLSDVGDLIVREVIEIFHLLEEMPEGCSLFHKHGGDYSVFSNTYSTKTHRGIIFALRQAKEENWGE